MVLQYGHIPGSGKHEHLFKNTNLPVHKISVNIQNCVSILFDYISL